MIQEIDSTTSMFSFRFRDDVRLLLEQAARTQERSMSFIIHKAILAYCQQYMESASIPSKN